MRRCALLLAVVLAMVSGAGLVAVPASAAAQDTVRLVLSRNRETGLATGFPSQANDGRRWALQVKAGAKWKQVGDKVAESGQRIHPDFPLGSHTYRLVGDPLAGLKAPTSGSESIASGPQKFGRHVMFVTTDSGTTPTKKGVDYTGTAAVDNDAPMALETVAVRGNSSARYPKKPYKLKFVDSQGPVGLPRGKSFILLPNYQDHSLVRTAVGIGMIAPELDALGWAPHRVFTELFINGKYLGSYELIESIKIERGSAKNDPRIPIDEEKGVVIEINPATHKGTPGLFKGSHGMYYGFKDPDEVKKKKDGTIDPEGVTSAKTKAVEKRIKNFESALYGSDYKDNKNGWQKYLDLDSAVDFYLEKVFLKDWDADFYRSTFFYTPDYTDPDAKFVMSPIWDIDRSAGVKTTTPSFQGTSGWWMNGDGIGHIDRSDDVHTKHWFVRIAKDPDFQKALKKRWDKKQGVFRKASKEYVDDAVSELTKTAAANDRKLWQKSQPTGRYGPRAGSFNGEISYLKKWYEGRYEWMNDRLE